MKKTNLIIGKPDSGKTRGYMFNQVKEMISNGENLFIWDNKEEYYNYFYNDLKDSHYTIKMVRLDEPENSNGFNILRIPYLLYKSGNVDKALLLIQELGVSMVNTSDNVTDFWDNNARDLLCSLILLLFKEGKKEEINFYSIVNLLRKIDEDQNKLIEDLRKYLSKLDVIDPIYSFGSASIFAPIETRSGIFATLKSALSSYIFRPAMLDLVSTDEIDLCKRDKTAIFFSGTGKNSSLGLVLLKQVLTKKEKDTSLVLIFDNLNKIPKISFIDDFIEYASNNNIISYFITNNYKELISMYGEFIFEGVNNVVQIEPMEIEYQDKTGVMPRIIVKERTMCNFEFLES